MFYFIRSIELYTNVYVIIYKNTSYILFNVSYYFTINHIFLHVIIEYRQCTENEKEKRGRQF